MTLLGLPESTQSRGASSIGTSFILRPAGLSTRVATIASANSRPEATMPAEITWPLPVIRSPHSSSDRCTRHSFRSPISAPVQKYFAPWINDDFKVTPNLTLTLGLRFDWSSGLPEQHGRFSTFSETAPNPAAGNHPGADVFGNQYAAGNSNWNVGPRIGFAYRLHDRNVIRGGYGIYYAGVPASLFNPYPTDGYQTNPTVPNLTNGEFPAFYWNNGFPAQAIQQPPVLNPSVMNGGSPVAVAKDSYLMPRYQNWSFSIQRQLSSNMALDVAYVGNHGTRLIAGSDFWGMDSNMNNPSVLAFGPSVLQSPN